MKQLKNLGAITLAIMFLAAVPCMAQSNGGGNTRNRARSERPEGAPSSNSSQNKGGNVRKSDNNKKKERASKSKDNARKNNRQPAATPPAGNGRPEGENGRQRPSERNGERPNGQNPSDRRPDGNRSDANNQPNRRQPDGDFRPNEGNQGQRPPEMRRPMADHRHRPDAGQPLRGKDGNMRPPMPPRAPQQLEPIGYDRPARFWDRGRHYFGHRIHSLPTNAVQRLFFGIPYYVLDDIYYRYYGDGYYVSRPPYGVGFSEPGYDETPYVCSFAYYPNSYYEFRTDNEFANAITKNNALTVTANVANAKDKNMTLDAYTALKACHLADELGLVQSFAEIGVDYYYSDGVFYTLSSDGRYYTIVPPAGALVYSLPEDNRMLILNEEEYYAVDETVYRPVTLVGKDYFEVVGQMTSGVDVIQ